MQFGAPDVPAGDDARQDDGVVHVLELVGLRDHEVHHGQECEDREHEVVVDRSAGLNLHDVPSGESDGSARCCGDEK